MPQYDPKNQDSFIIHKNIQTTAISAWSDLFRGAYLGLIDKVESAPEVEAFMWKLSILCREYRYHINGTMSVTMRDVIRENKIDGLKKRDAALAVLAYMSRLCYIDPDKLPEDSLSKASGIACSVFSKSKMDDTTINEIEALMVWDQTTPSWGVASALYGDMLNYRVCRMNVETTESTYKKEYGGVPDLKWYNYIINQYHDFYKHGIFYTTPMQKQKEGLARANCLRLMESADKRLAVIEAEIKVLASDKLS